VHFLPVFVVATQRIGGFHHRARRSSWQRTSLGHFVFRWPLLYCSHVPHAAAVTILARW
jgi:hypothetical protein